MNRADWQNLTDVRLDEAQALLQLSPPRPDGAYYLAGYAVECALKAAIARLTNQYDWPEKAFVNECHTHSILALVRLSELDGAREQDAAVNPAFARNWGVVQTWNESARYERHSLADARKIIDAVTHTTNGVLPWIKARW